MAEPKTEEEIEQAIEDLNETIADVANDTDEFTSEQSIEIWRGVEANAKFWAEQIARDADLG